MDIQELARKAVERAYPWVSRPVGTLSDALGASYPVFKEEMSQAPLGALNEMAQYERENPLGSALSFMGNVVAGKGARGFKQAESLGRVFGGAVDQLPRFEIADDVARVKNPSWKAEYKVGDYLDHPELFENYPELNDVKVQQLNLGHTANAGTKGAYDPVTNTITLNADKYKAYPNFENPEDVKSTLLHEIQHAIQEREGFAKGGNPGEIASDIKVKSRIDHTLGFYKQALQDGEIKDGVLWYKDIGLGSMDDVANTIKDLENEIQNVEYSNQFIDPYEQYRRLAGEQEAFNVQKRMNWTDAERQAKPFNETFDVPVEQQIKRMKSGTMASVTDNPNFKKWFGDSKVVNEKGEPLKLYHGTLSPGYSKFEKGKDGAVGPGIYLTTNPNKANVFAGISESVINPGKLNIRKEGGAVYPLHANIKRPYTVDIYDQKSMEYAKSGMAQKDGFDGLYIPAVGEYVVFDPTQIKSAIGNSGAFDPKDPNILKSLAPVGGAVAIERKKGSNKSTDKILNLLKEIDRLKS